MPVPVVIALRHPAEGPAAERERDTTRAGFDHAASQQELIQVGLALALVRILAIQTVPTTKLAIFAGATDMVQLRRLGKGA